MILHALNVIYTHSQHYNTIVLFFIPSRSLDTMFYRVEKTAFPGLGRNLTKTNI